MSTIAVVNLLVNSGIAAVLAQEVARYFRSDDPEEAAFYEEVMCPQCGNGPFKGARGLAIHWGKMH